MRIHVVHLLLLLLTLSLSHCDSSEPEDSQPEDPQTTITGKIIDAESLAPLPGAVGQVQRPGERAATPYIPDRDLLAVLVGAKV